MKIDKELKDLFLDLCRYNTPYGTEAYCYSIISDIVGPLDDCMDAIGNIWLKLGDSNDDVAFMSHLDNACSVFQPIDFKINNGVVSKKPSRIPGVLGADDKAGVALMLRMIQENMPGNYLFFVGEERGCIGSGYFADKMDYNFQQAISFDRYGIDEVIYEQMCNTASYKYAEALGKCLGLYPSTHGIYTDSAEFESTVPECVNVAVGYQHHHTPAETQDLKYLTLLLKKVLNTDFEGLPITRDPKAPSQTWGYNQWDDYGISAKPSRTKPTDIDELSDEEWREWISENYGDNLGEPKIEQDIFAGLEDPNEIIQRYEEEVTKGQVVLTVEQDKILADAYYEVYLQEHGATEDEEDEGFH